MDDTVKVAEASCRTPDRDPGQRLWSGIRTGPVMPDSIRHPERIEYTGSRHSPGWRDL